MEVAGVDGCRAGWLIVRAEVADPLRLVALFIAPTFKELTSSARHCAAVAVDIPIGLTDGPERLPDVCARNLLGQPRARSVFRAPCWPVLEETTDDTEYREVCQVSRKHCRRKDGQPAAMSQQAWRIMRKVREANLAMTPAPQKSIVEVHPEESFWAMNERRAMSYSKKKPEGETERRRVLYREFGDSLMRLRRPPNAAWDDVLDACAAAWSAWRFAEGRAERLPPDPPRDAKSLKMEIVY